jgi:ZIP family zinc transporter
VSGYLPVLGLAALPAIANLVGGLLAEVITLSPRVLSLAFQWVAGMLLGVVGIELMPRALQAPSPWLIVVAFVLGGVFFLIFEEEVLPSKRVVEGAIGNPWGIFSAILFDLFVTGVLIATGETVEKNLGLLLALSLLVVDAPEGFATIANLRRYGVARTIRFLLLLALVASVLIGASLGYLLLQGHDSSAKLGLLAFTAGMLILLVAKEMLPYAKEAGEAGVLLLLGGFALVALFSAYVG